MHVEDQARGYGPKGVNEVDSWKWLGKAVSNVVIIVHYLEGIEQPWSWLRGTGAGGMDESLA